MDIIDATIQALQGKLTERLDFTVNNKWIPYAKSNPKLIEDYIKRIADTNKPVKYSYIAGYDNWMAIVEEKELSLDEVKDMFLTSNSEYIVVEHEDYVLIRRMDSRW